MSNNPYPVDSNVTVGAGIPAEDLARLIRATIPEEEVLKDMSELDDKDKAILAERQIGLDTKTYPKQGDWVKLPDGTYSRITHVFPTVVQLDTGRSGRFYLGETGYCSYSGGLSSGVHAESLVRSDERKIGKVWFFHHNRSVAHNGLDAYAEFPVWVSSENDRG